MSLRDQLQFLVGLSRGLARGDRLPAAGRQRPAAAPGGTVPPPPPPAGNQAAAFAVAEHHLPLVGLGAPLRLLQLSDVHVRGPVRWLDRLVRFTRTLPEADLVLIALVGVAGLKPALAAIEAGNDNSVASKESLVKAGHAGISAARRQGV